MTDVGEIEDPARRGKTSLFPLPLTPFKLMMWFDHRPEYPMVFPLVCEFTGEVDRECVQQALDVVCARHPLLSARVESNRRQRYWVASADRLNRINWDAQPQSSNARSTCGTSRGCFRIPRYFRPRSDGVALSPLLLRRPECRRGCIQMVLDL